MRSFLRIFFFLFLGLILIVAGILLWRFIGYAQDKDPNKTFLAPRVKATRVEISSLTSDSSKIMAYVDIQTYVPFSFQIDSVQYTIFMDSTEILHSTYNQPILFKPSAKTPLVLPMTLLTKDFKAAIKRNEDKGIDTVEYRVIAVFYTDLFFKKQFEVDMANQLPLYHFPELKLEEAEVDSLNFSRVALTFHTTINNENAFSIKPSNVSYKLTIEDHAPIYGKVADAKELKANSVTPYDMPISIRFSEMGQTLKDIYKEGKQGRYSLELYLTLGTESALLNNTKLTLQGSGDIKSTLKKKKDKGKKKKKDRD